ncbi:MAG: hypothetical protein H6806_04375 [Planctomycetes bacterium]|nr:hypothetical protein [Planctomycetota bacterium]
MTATLVKKGQSIDGTRAAFAAMREVGIKPMPMMMHDDTQPLLTIGSARGLLNQVQMLRSAGAMSLQVLLLSPAHGTKLYYETHESGLAYESVNGQPVTPHMVDGNHVVASRAKHPWLRQLNVLIAYTWFYNPVRLMWALVASKSRRGWFVDAAFQAWGMAGLLRNYARSPRWMWHLFRGGRHPVRSSEVPVTRAAACTRWLVRRPRPAARARPQADPPPRHGPVRRGAGRRGGDAARGVLAHSVTKG